MADRKDNLLQFPSNSLRTSQIAEGLFSQALDLEKEGAVAEAKLFYTRTLELDNTRADAYVNLGTIFFHENNLEEAKRCYKKSIEIDPEYAMALFNLGCTLDSERKYDQALEYYALALTINPNYSDVHYNMAVTYDQKGQLVKAIKHFKAYCKVYPGHCVRTKHAKKRISVLKSLLSIRLAIVRPRKEP